MAAKVAAFLTAQVLKGQFWFLFLASFTIVLMMAWRSALRDTIFWDAAATVGRRPGGNAW